MARLQGGRGEPVSAGVPAQSPAPGGGAAGEAWGEGREVPANQREITAENTRKGLATTRVKGQRPSRQDKRKGTPQKRAQRRFVANQGFTRS